jgi:hypothetical protein
MNRLLWLGFLATAFGCQVPASSAFSDLSVQSLADGDYYFRGASYSMPSNNIASAPEVLLSKRGNIIIGWAADEGVECFRWVINSETEVEATEYYPESQELSPLVVMSGKLIDAYPTIQSQANLADFTRDNPGEILSSCAAHFGL